MGAEEIKVEFFYLDNETCSWCGDTEKALDEAVAEAEALLARRGVKIRLEKVHLTSAEQAAAHGVVISPTVRIDGYDLQGEIEEKYCPACSELSGEEVNCRVWRYKGKEYTAPPREMIVEALLRAAEEENGKKKGGGIFSPALASAISKFFQGRERRQSASSCCTPAGTGGSSGSSCCIPPAEEEGEGASSCCGPARDSVPEAGASVPPCPSCGKGGQRVGEKTVKSLVREEFKGRVAGDYYLCLEPDCSVVYYNAKGESFTKEAVRVPVWFKEKSDDVPICYCAGVTRKEIKDAVLRHGAKTLAEVQQLTGAMTGCECVTKNPAGKCCSTVVKALIEEALQERGEKLREASSSAGSC